MKFWVSAYTQYGNQFGTIIEAADVNEMVSIFERQYPDSDFADYGEYEEEGDEMEKNITKETLWTAYPSDTLYLFKSGMLYVIQEGDGCNLDDDEENGYVDYWNTYLFDIDGKVDGGMWLETKLIRDAGYTIDGIINRMKECDAPKDIDSYEILDPVLGEFIFSNANR